MSRTPNLCVYCGNPGITKEHHWGRWAKKYERHHSERSVHVLRRWRDPEKQEGPYYKKGALSRPGSLRSQTLKIACRDCNTGWMKGIVDAAIPIVLPLSQGHWSDFSDADRTKLTRWIIMFTMSHEFADRETVAVSERERRDYSRTQEISGHWQVAIGAGLPSWGHDETFHRSLTVEGPSSEGRHPKIAITAFAFGEVIAVAVYDEMDLEVAFPDVFRKLGLHPIWPLSGTPIGRPFIGMGYGGVNVIVEIITKNITKLERPDLP